MSNTDKNASEEIDFGPIFNALSAIFTGIKSAVVYLVWKSYSLVIYSIKAIIVNYKVIVPVLLLAFLAGLFNEKKSKPLYNSKMLVMTYFDSKYQLVENLNYYNALIANKDTNELSRVFKIDVIDLESLYSFEISPGLETRNDQLKYYDTYLKQIDTSMTEVISFDEFIKNRDLLSGNLFEINVIAEKKDVFRKLENGLKGSFANNHSVKVKSKRDSSLTLKSKTIKSQIEQINDLKETYVSVLKQQAETPNLKMGFSEIPVTEELPRTFEYDLLKTELSLRDRLRDIEETKIKYNEFYDILSSFQETGTRYKSLTTNYKIVYPLYVFILMIFIFCSRKLIMYIKNYE